MYLHFTTSSENIQPWYAVHNLIFINFVNILKSDNTTVLNHITQWWLRSGINRTVESTKHVTADVSLMLDKKNILLSFKMLYNKCSYSQNHIVFSQNSAWMFLQLDICYLFFIFIFLTHLYICAWIKKIARVENVQNLTYILETRPDCKHQHFGVIAVWFQSLNPQRATQRCRGNSGPVVSITYWISMLTTRQHML